MRRAGRAQRVAALIGGMALLCAVAAGCARAVPVPDVTGATLPQASKALVGAGLAVGEVAEQPSEEVATGLVISQDPAPGELLEPGATVALTVSSGPALVAVPDVVGMTPEDATTALENAGLAVEEYVADGPVDPDAGNADVGRVYRQTPAAGAKVQRGTTVEIRYWFESGG